MKKKTKKLMPLIVSGVALLFGIVAFCLMFADALKVVGVTYTGSQIAFGYSEKILVESVQMLGFNFLAFLAYLLPVIGGVLGLVFSKSKLFSIISAALFAVGAVLIFMMGTLFPIGIQNETISNAIANHAKIELLAATIVAGILAILGALTSAGKLALK